MTTRELNASGHPGRIWTVDLLRLLALGARTSAELAATLGKKRQLVTLRCRQLTQRGLLVQLRGPKGRGRYATPGKWKINNAAFLEVAHAMLDNRLKPRRRVSK